MDFPIIPPGRADDIHNLEVLPDCDLIIFMAGNQFMVMDELLDLFKRKHPEIKRIFFETLPPGFELKQILAGGAYFKNRLLPGIPDVYTSVSLKGMQKLEEAGLIERGVYRVYLHNRIVLMVAKGNPLNIKSVKDLARDEVRVSQPNPDIEDIGIYILNMYRKAGGDNLVYRIMEEKRAEGTTIYTMVHHRETPIRLKKGTVDVGPVWATEVIQAQKEGLEVEKVEVGEEFDQRKEVNYYITIFKNSPNYENARKFLEFILSKEAQIVYEKFGFVPEVDLK